MSNVERDPAEQTVRAGRLTEHAEPEHELLEPREVPLGGPRAMLVRRCLPHRERRMVGAWCFADSYGPTTITGQAGMLVPPHPHIGLQTVSWLVDGEIWHEDSLGSACMVRKGELNLMTAGHGIAHAEQSPAQRGPVLHGVQLWTALPGGEHDVAPHFERHTDLPRYRESSGTVTVFMGELAGASSPARTYSPLVGADVSVRAGRRLRVELAEDFEHAVLALAEPITVTGTRLDPGSMLYLGRGCRGLSFDADVPARALLIGGVPFDEELVMWWNFVARGHDEIVEARSAWEAARTNTSSATRFGDVVGYPGPWLPAPELPHVRLRARGRYRRRGR